MTITYSPQIAAMLASSCETCRIGCTCSGPDTGCGHYGCWGYQDAADCPEAIRIRALDTTRREESPEAPAWSETNACERCSRPIARSSADPTWRHPTYRNSAWCDATRTVAAAPVRPHPVRTLPA